MGILNQLGLAGNTPANVGNESAGKTASTALLISLAMMHSDVAIGEAELELQSINADCERLEGLHNVQQRLTNMVSRVENIAVDGLTQREAGFVTDSVNEINAELGADLIAMPALESFGDKISAKNYTSVGLEAADGGLAKAWDYIIATLKKIKDMFATWWDKFFGSVEKLKSYAEKVKSGAEKYNDDKEDKKITIKGKTLYTGGSKPTAASIKAGMTKVEASVSGFIGAHGKVVEATTDALEKAMDGADGTAAKLKSAADTISAKDDVKKYLAATHLAASVPATGVVFGADVMGDKTVVVSDAGEVTVEDTTASRADFYKALAKVSYKVKGSDDKKDTKDVTIDRLSKSDVEDIADKAIELADGILELRKSRQDARKYADDITKAAEGLKKDATSLEDEDKANRGELTAMSKASTSVLKEVSGGAVASWTSHIVNVANAALKAAEQSI
ncbi:hypothetical protein TSMG0014 [Halocynthia phage JM-2012]|uniref:hypothetical protein n=1 Tax=Halocynthia phage JM-2012 TaxID=1173297 RepID=UPI00025C68DD|nr:hypothetical protein TSMG0014 [Halocynthia phage JM-2012]AFI55297.1 hypothetical protein TSMG0014 [Halocynthia phage JM-2012]